MNILMRLMKKSLMMRMYTKMKMVMTLVSQSPILFKQ